MQKMETEFWCHTMVEVGHATYTDRFHELSRLVPHLVTPENKRIESYIYGLTPQIRVMNGALKKNTKKRGNNEEPSRDGNVRDDNKRAFVMGAEEAHQDPNIVTVTFTLNNHYATTIFDYGFDYSLVSTTFIPLLDIKPSNLGFSYEIEIASGQLVEINKVIRGCKLEIKGYIFDIDLISFRHESFDFIVGMDWLSMHKAEIVCHEKVVRIPLPNSVILRVLGERPKEKVRHSKSAKVKEQKLKDIVVVRNFFEVFPDDLSGLPSSKEIKFYIDLIPGAMP
nr:putative reverse transcriptase domain-containing protein [Tanacetum cinerariifolium]